MKSLLVVLALMGAPACIAADKPAAAPGVPALTGQVLEVKDTEMYTYLRLKTKDGETWAAVGRAPVKKGEQVTIDGPMTMTDFESKALNRKFDRLVLGNLRGAPGAAAAVASGGSPHGGTTAKSAEVGDVKVAKASGKDAHTVAEIVTRRTELKDKSVVLRAKVVKYTGGIMGKNWLHLRDGTGSSSTQTHDLVVTTTDAAKVGDVVVARGVVRTDRDLGSGYVYKVLVEDAKLQKQ